MKLNPVFNKHQLYFITLNNKEEDNTKINRRFTKIDTVMKKVTISINEVKGAKKRNKCATQRVQ